MKDDSEEDCPKSILDRLCHLSWLDLGKILMFHCPDAKDTLH